MSEQEQFSAAARVQEWRSRLECASPIDARTLSTPERFAERVIYEDNHLLVLDKPVGLATQGAEAGEDSLFTLAKRYIKQKYNKPGDAFLGVVSRLDLPVSGVVVFARTSKAAERLNDQIRNHTVVKTYEALLEGVLPNDQGELVNFICEDRLSRRLWIHRKNDFKRDVDDKRLNAKEARLVYRVLSRYKANTLVEVNLQTGRKHQIRLQFSHLGFPIVGDGKYGAKIIKARGVCLHSAKLEITHPTLKVRMRFISFHPDWARFLADR